MAKGGARPGAGRPRKDRGAQGAFFPTAASEKFETAEAYLSAVVAGKVRPDSVRVRAACALLSFELPKSRPKPKGLPPSRLAAQADLRAEASRLKDFEEKAEQIRLKHRKQGER